MTTLLTRDARSQGSVQSPVLEPFRMMRDLFRWDPLREAAWVPQGTAAFLPGFDIKETPSAYLFNADLPGIRLEDLDIHILGNRLSISGRREAEVQDEHEVWHLTERNFGTFSRSFTLPVDIDAAQVEAHLDQGVLMLTLAKSPAAQPQKVRVQPGS